MEGHGFSLKLKVLDGHRSLLQLGLEKILVRGEHLRRTAAAERRAVLRGVVVVPLHIAFMSKNLLEELCP